MSKKTIFLIISIVICIFVIGLIMMKGKPADRANLDSISEIGEGVIYSVDQVGRVLSPISEEEEMRVGDMIHKRVERSPANDKKETVTIARYVSEVGQRVAAGVKRKGIAYKFHVLDVGGQRAFSSAGGHIYITTGLLAALRSEAELAGILGHEIVHVDAKHCVNYIRHHAGSGGSDRLVSGGYNLFWRMGYSKAEETEADAGGVYLAMMAGYHPMAVVEAFKRVDKTYSETNDNSSITPVGDTLMAMGGMVGRYFSSHPVAIERIDKIKKYIADNKLIGPTSKFYVGERNYKEKVSYQTTKYKEELKKNYSVIESKVALNKTLINGH